jgi:photosystem II stability/assembly factor-like uncharacterized protein
LSRISDLAVGPSTVWAVTDDCNLAYERCVAAIVKSNDGGVTWQRVATPSSLLRERGSAQLVVADDSHAFILTRADNTSEPRLVSTDDGGSSWAALPFIDDCDAAKSQLIALDAQRLWLVCAGGYATAMERRVIARSDDGGRTWHIALNAIVSGHFAHLATVSASVAYIGLSRGYLIVTTDGGSTWHTTDALLGNADRLVGPSFFFDERHGVVGDSDPERDQALRIWRTNDGGRSWQEAAVD